MQQIQLTIYDDNEASLLIQLLQKFDSVRVKHLKTEEATAQDVEAAVLENWGEKNLVRSFQQAEQDIKKGKVYTVDQARKMLQKKLFRSISRVDCVDF